MAATETPELQARATDPRILRTRGMLHCALARLLADRPFASLSVQQIADAAGVNRVTFYDHYADKLDLLNGMVATRFQDLLAERRVTFDGTCASALTDIARAVCDFLASAPGGTRSPRPDTSASDTSASDTATSDTAASETERHFESALVAVVRNLLLEGLSRHPSPSAASPEMLAGAASWAIYGAAREWLHTPNRPPAAQTAELLAHMVAPLLHP